MKYKITRILRVIKDFPNYRITTDGQVYSITRGHYLKPYITNAGYYKINLYKNGKYKKFFVHRLVANAFLPNLDNLPVVNHKDENKLNNNV